MTEVLATILNPHCGRWRATSCARGSPLGIIIGVGAVIAMVGLGNGAQAQVEEQIASLGQNMILDLCRKHQTSGVRTGGGRRHAEGGRREAIAREVPGVVRSARNPRHGPGRGGKSKLGTSFSGNRPEYFDMRQWPLTGRRGLYRAGGARGGESGGPRRDDRRPSSLATADPVGQIIAHRKRAFHVIGLLKAKGMSLHGHRSGRRDVRALHHAL